MSYPRNPAEGNPFWDFIASLNNVGADHPLYAAFNPEARNRGPPPGYDAPRPANSEGSPPAQSDEDPPVPPLPGCHQDPFDNRRPNFPFGGGRSRHGGPHHHRGGPHGSGGWGHYRGRGGPNFNAGGWPNMGGFDMSKLGELIQQFIPNDDGAAVPRPRAAGSGGGDGSERTGGKDFAPEADIFDTEDAYVVHISLPGAKKEDVGVNWDADRSELNVAGVIYRPGDEEFLKTLALDERKVGVFERKVRLGSRQAPAAQVESEGISARMEDGILMITIPKVDKDFVEVRKVDIE